MSAARPRHSSAGIGKRLRARLERLLGTRVVSTRCIYSRGYTLAERWLILLPDGSMRFVKVGMDAVSRDQVRTEASIVSQISGSFLPGWDGFDDHPLKPLLVMEDLEASFWPPPWRDGDVDRVLRALGDLHSTPPPPGLRGAEHVDWGGWDVVADDPEPFLSLGMASASWLDRWLDDLLAAEASAPLAGDALVHLDVRSDNLCITGERVVFVDWGSVAVGNPDVDLALWAPSLEAEGGPPPEELLEDAGELAAFVAGLFACRAGLPPQRPGAGRIRTLQRDQLASALPWACRALGIEPPI